MDGTFSTVPLNVNEVSGTANNELDALVRNYSEVSDFAFPSLAIILVILVIIALWFSVRGQKINIVEMRRAV